MNWVLILRSSFFILKGSMKIVVTIVLSLGAFNVFSQRPSITSVEPLNTYPLESILITGSGFGNNAASIQVWFDQVKGTVVSVSDVSIQVTVPPQARLHNIEVINLSSKLSAKAPLKFMPTYSGEGFDPTKLTAPLSFASVNAIFDVCACDLDNDNKPELVGTKFENTATDIVILDNKSTVGNLAFDLLDKSTLTVLNINGPTGHVACGDLNGDGRPEIVASRSGTTANSIYVLQNSSISSPNFIPRIELFLEPGHFARQVAINDLNADGKPEIIVANSFNNTLYIFLNQSTGGGLSISATPIKISMTGVPNSLALEVQDMNGDLLPDIVMTQNQGPSIFILRNQSAGTVSFAAPVTIVVPGSFNDVTAADVNKDGKLDLVLTSVFTAQAMVLINQSTVPAFAFGTPITLTTGNGPFGVDVSDIDGDVFPDIIIPNRGVGGIDVFLHNQNIASPGFTRVVIPTAKTNWFVKAGDLDGDAKPDIAFSSFNNATSNFTIEILRNQNCFKPEILNEGPLVICTGQTVQLVSPKSPAATFTWRNGAATIKNGADNFVDITTAGTYTVTATSEGGACTVVSAPLIVTSGLGTAPSTPTINAIAAVCAGSTLVITTANVASATYLWEGPGGFSSSTAVPSLSIPTVRSDQAGIYTLRVKVGDCISNPDTEVAQVVNLGSFSVSSNAAGPLCQGQSALLSVNTATGHTYQWIKDGVDIGGQMSNTLTATQEGNYRVRVSFSGCSAETPDSPVVILSPPTSNFNLSSTSACIGENVTFTNTSPVDSRATVSYSWEFDDGTTFTGENAVHAYGAVQDYSPTLHVSYVGVTGCSSSTSKLLSITEAVPPLIEADLLEICAGESAQLNVQGSYTTIDWNTGQSGPNITINQPGAFSVSTVDASGCTGQDEIVIDESEGCGAIEITIPNMFSPNLDGQNDRWVIPGVENYPECTMSVYDDKGVRVFRGESYPLEGWDGLSNGKPMPEGVYYYMFTCPTGKPVIGSLLIIR
jgi:gliding motility-associated-like protein